MSNKFTISDCLKKSDLLDVESDSARLDTELLLAKSIGKTRTFLYTWPEKSLTKQETAVFEALFKRRLQGEPIAYILGEKEFWSRNFLVNQSTLIPRDDTECLVDYAIRMMLSLMDDSAEQSKACNILDLGTGSGAIGITLALEFPGSSVVAVDLNDEAVILAKKNASLLGANNITIFQSNWFFSVSGLYEIIVSNPPYIDKLDHHLNEGDVRFEPNTALISDDKGLADIRAIVKSSRDYLIDGGYLLVEHGYDQGALVRAIFNECSYSCVRTEKDLSGNDRFCVARLVSSA